MQLFFIKACSNTAFLPENIDHIQIEDKNLIFTIKTTNGINRLAFQSNVPLSGNLNSISGVKRIQILAQEDSAQITNA